jgi:hypothetical protein
LSDAREENREIELEAGGHARLLEADLEFATLDLPAAFPPGSTLMLRVAGAPLGLKVRSCRRLSEGENASYRITGRFVSLSRAQRLALGLE